MRIFNRFRRNGSNNGSALVISENKFSNLFNIRRVIALILALILIGLIILSLGNSETTSISQKEASPEYQNDPSNLQNPYDPLGGNPLPLDQFPSLFPPDNAITNFDPSVWGNGGVNQGGGGNNFSIPTSNIPTSLPTGPIPSIDGGGIGSITQGIGTGIRPNNPLPKGGDNPLPNNQPNNNIGLPDPQPIDFSFGNRTIKAKFLPKVNLTGIKLIKLDFGFIGLGEINIQINVNTSSMLLLTIFILAFTIYKIVLPKLLLLSNDQINKNIDQVVYLEADLEAMEALKRRQERKKKLLVFQDHVNEIIERSQIRLDSQNAGITILLGYQELDEAFNAFSALRRGEGVTPLEHSHQIFETGEINNGMLEKIVFLFYEVRFGEKEVFSQHGIDFINYLRKLIVTEGEIVVN